MPPEWKYTAEWDATDDWKGKAGYSPTAEYTTTTDRQTISLPLCLLLLLFFSVSPRFFPYNAHVFPLHSLPDRSGLLSRLPLRHVLSLVKLVTPFSPPGAPISSFSTLCLLALPLPLVARP